MSKGTKLGIAVSVLSVLVIGGSVYYYNSSISKTNEKVQQTLATTTVSTTQTTETKLVLNKENVKITTEVKDEKTAVVTIENIAERNLAEVVVEANYREGKIAEVLIPTLNKGEQKKLELPLNNKLNAASIKDNQSLSSDFRTLERVEFTAADGKGEILVSSLKAQEKEFYIEKIKSSSLEQAVKNDLIKKVEESKDISEIEKLLKDNKLIEDVNLSGEHVVFKDGESELKVEATNNSEITSTISTMSSVSSSSVSSTQEVMLVQTSVYTGAAVNTSVINSYVTPRPVTRPINRAIQQSGNVNSNPSNEPQVGTSNQLTGITNPNQPVPGRENETAAPAPAPTGSNGQ